MSRVEIVSASYVRPRVVQPAGTEMVPPAAYEPWVYYNCDDPECCMDGSPQVICRHCKHDWPCDDYQANHTLRQVNSQKRWVVRVKHRVEYPDLIEYCYLKDGIAP